MYVCVCACVCMCVCVYVFMNVMYIRLCVLYNVCRYGDFQRMAEGRLPKIALKWMPKQKRARGRPKKNWMEGIRMAMNERNLNEGQWEDRKQWSLGVGQRRKAC